MFLSALAGAERGRWMADRLPRDCGELRQRAVGGANLYLYKMARRSKVSQEQIRPDSIRSWPRGARADQQGVWES